jgi:hypothetical protein
MMSDYDKANIDAIMNGQGDWYGAQLLRLLSKADEFNRELIRKGYPEEVEAWERWYYGDSYDSYRETRDAY